MLSTVILAALLSGCGYNTLQSSDEQVKAAWSEVLNQYQRRADLVPNLVNVVKGAAAQEKRFQDAQASLTSALSRLLAVVENYPQLQSIQAYRDLQAQLEGIENRIAVARKRYIESVQSFNTTVRSFPTNLTAMMFGFKTKPNFTVENESEISKPPTVDFGTEAPPVEKPATEPSS
jgi:LemA protein